MATTIKTATKKKPLVIGHRGAAGLSPENTMVGFERALAEGADWIHCDVRTTKDKRFVILHDPTLDRTTSGKGRVLQFPLYQVRALDAGSWFQPRYRGEHVPILEETLDWAKERMGILLDCKAVDPRALATLLKRFQMAKGIVVSFEKLSDLKRFRSADPKTPAAMTVIRSSALGPLAKAGCRYLNVKAGLWGEPFAEKAAAFDISVNLWTADKESEIEKALKIPPHGIISGYPDRVRKALAALATKA